MAPGQCGLSIEEVDNSKKCRRAQKVGCSNYKVETAFNMPSQSFLFLHANQKGLLDVMNVQCPSGCCTILTSYPHGANICKVCNKKHVLISLNSVTLSMTGESMSSM
jgi:hypothetical protein